MGFFVPAILNACAFRACSLSVTDFLIFVASDDSWRTAFFYTHGRLQRPTKTTCQHHPAFNFHRGNSCSSARLPRRTERTLETSLARRALPASNTALGTLLAPPGRSRWNARGGAERWPRAEGRLRRAHSHARARQRLAQPRRFLPAAILVAAPGLAAPLPLLLLEERRARLVVPSPAVPAALRHSGRRHVQAPPLRSGRRLQLQQEALWRVRGSAARGGRVGDQRRSPVIRCPFWARAAPRGTGPLPLGAAERDGNGESRAHPSAGPRPGLGLASGGGGWRRRGGGERAGRGREGGAAGRAGLGWGRRGGAARRAPAGLCVRPADISSSTCPFWCVSVAFFLWQTRSKGSAWGSACLVPKRVGTLFLC